MRCFVQMTQSSKSRATVENLIEKGCLATLVALCLLLLTFFSTRASDLSFETELLALAPIDARYELEKKATRELGREFQSRVTFLIEASDALALADAESTLREQLGSVDALHFSDGAAAQLQLVDALVDHRFHLLSKAQRSELQSGDRAGIVRRALIERMGLGGGAQLFDVAIDPLAWHSRTITELAAQSLNGTTEPLVTTVSAVLSNQAFAVDSQAGLKQQLLAVIDEVEDLFPQTKIIAGGVFFHATSAATNSKSDAVLISTAASVMVLILLISLFRSATAILVPVVSVAVGIGSGFATSYQLFEGLHVITLVFGASLIGIVIDYSLHFFIHEHASSERESRLPLYRALILSCFTSVIAYSVLGASGHLILGQVAVFSSVGLVSALITVVALCPLVARRVSLNDQRLSSLLRALSLRLSSLTPSMIIILAAIGLSSLIFSRDWLLRSGNDPSEFINADVAQLAVDQRIAAATRQFEPGRFLFVSGKNIEEVYQRTNAYLDTLGQREDAGLGDFLSLTTIVPSPTEQSENYALNGVVYEADGLLDQFLSVASLSVDKEALRSSYLDSANRRLEPLQLNTALAGILPPLWFKGETGRELSVMLVPQGASIAALREVAADFEGVDLVNVLEASQSGLFEKKASGLSLLFPLMALVIAFLLLVYRKLSAVLIVVVPVVSVTLVAAGFAFFGHPVTLFHLMAMYLAVGLGLDYGIFAYEIRSPAGLAARAIFVSAITSIMSFGLMSVSSTPVVQGFGLTLLLANILNMLGALWLSAWLASQTQVHASPRLK